MNYAIEKHMQILELTNICDYDEINEQTLKKQYYKLARYYHPDKNPHENTHHKFQEIHESYEYLMKYYGYLDDNSDEPIEEEKEDIDIQLFPSIWTNYIGHFLQSDLFFTIKTQLFHSIITKLCNKCENTALELLQQLDSKMLEKFACILIENRLQLPLTDDFIDNLKTLVQEKRNSKKKYILRPKLEDLQDEQLYKLKVGNETLYIPLWHHELEYDIHNEEINVEIIPKLDNNIEIDEKNNIYVYKKYNIKELWNTVQLDFQIGNKNYTYNRNDLKLTPLQEIKFVNQGIPLIYTQNIYNVERKSDIIIVILLEL